jgi:mRNA-degrading endonuclease YafQ of YafQ-DinJ toxin-antitoxin module
MKKYGLDFSKEFISSYKKLLRKNKLLRPRFKKALGNLSENPFYKGLRTHRVKTRKYGERYSSRVTGDLRIIWDFYKGRLVIIVIAIGGHEGKRSVYK